MFNKYSQAGMMLVSILMLTLLLVMLTTSMLLMSSHNLNITGFAEKKAQALQAAEAGVEYAFYNINEDSTWGTSITADIAENLENNQSFTIIFNSLSPEYSRNNLTNKTPSGTTPGYAAEIISKGNYKGTEKTIRAIFVRDDIFPYPVISEGEIFINANSTHLYVVPNTSVYTVKGKNSTNPGMHSNKKIKIFSGCPVDFSGGFVSSKNTVSVSGPPGLTVQRKEYTPPLTIPDIDIASIISNRPACHTLTQNRFYLAGYFEYDHGNYCVPHTAPSAFPAPYGWPDVISAYYSGAYKKGMIYFQPKLTPSDACRNFFHDYGEFYYNPGGPTRNLYNYITSMNFIDFDGPTVATDLQNELAVTLLPPDTTSEPNCTILTLRLDEDLYINGITGIFTTGEIGRVIPYDYPGLTVGHQVRLDLNGHKIYADKPLYLGIPVTGSGAIISNETIDFTLASDPNNLVVLSGKSINITYKEPYETPPIPMMSTPLATVTFKGIIYAKDDLVILPYYTHSQVNVDIKGSLVAKDINNNNTALPPMSPVPWWGPSPYTNTYCSTGEWDRISILHTDDGIDTLVSLRGANFNVRKDSWEILK